MRFKVDVRTFQILFIKNNLPSGECRDKLIGFFFFAQKSTFQCYNMVSNNFFGEDSMITTYYLLVNPASGGGKGQETALEICKRMKQHQLPYTCVYTNYAQHEKKLTREWINKHKDQTQLLVVIGGDGTLHQVVNELYRNKCSQPIAYIPAGSGNDFARAFGIPLDIEGAFQHLIQTKNATELHLLKYREKDSNTFNIILNNLGIGIDGAIVYTANHSNLKKSLQKIGLGKLTYLISALRVLFTQKGFPLTITEKGRTQHFKNAFLCTATNHPYFGGGVKISPSTSATAPIMTLVVLERIPLYKIFWLLILLSRGKHEISKHLHYYHTDDLKLSTITPEFMQIDGESFEKQPQQLEFSFQSQLFWL